MTDETKAAAERISQRLKDGNKVRGFRGLNGAKQIVGLWAADLALCAGAVEDPDPKVRDLLKGASAGKLEKEVYVHADDAFYLLDVVQ